MQLANVYGAEIALQPNGKILVSGPNKYDGIFRWDRSARLNRLETNGSLDSAFSPVIADMAPVSVSIPVPPGIASADNYTHLKMMALPNGSILLGGNFTSLNGMPYDRLALINGNGELYSRPVLSPVKNSATGQLLLRLSGPVDRAYAIEASSNLRHWMPLYTNFAPELPLQWEDLEATNFLERFYRTVSR